MTNTQLLQKVYIHLGTEEETGLVEPVILAMANTALIDTARYVIDTDPQLAKRFIATSAGLSISSSSVSAPADMIYHTQKGVVRVEAPAGTLAYQVQDRDKLNMMDASAVNNYYALQGTTFYFKLKSSSPPTTCDIIYYKIPLLNQMTQELEPIFLDLLFKRLSIAMRSSAPQPIMDTTQEVTE